MSEIDDVLRKIRALRTMTSDRGFTEAEALAAAEAARRLAAKHGLDEETINCARVVELRVERGREPAAVVGLNRYIAEYCGVMAWSARRGGATVYFGHEPDVEVAAYVHTVCFRAIAGACGAFRQSTEYRRRRKPATKRIALNAFALGMASGLASKLRQLLRDDPEAAAATERKIAAVSEAAERRSIKLTMTKSSGGKAATSRQAEAARQAGHAAGRSVAVNPGVGGASPARPALPAPAGMIGHG